MPTSTPRFRVPAALLACLAVACGRPEPRATNVLLIVADTLRADRLGCYRYPRATSPTIDALAAEGVLYEDSHSQACWTLPSMISMMAGVPVTKKETVLPKLPVLAEVLQERGYTTAAFIAQPTVGVDRGFDRGFDHFGELYEERAPGVGRGFADWLAQWTKARREPESSESGKKGFFAWVHFTDPHHPYDPAPENDVFHDPRPDLERLRPRWKAEEPRVKELSPGLAGLDFDAAVAEMSAASNRYDGEVRAVDDGVRLVLEALRASGEAERTLIIFCADHGEMLYEHPNYPFFVDTQIKENGGLPGGVLDLFAQGHRPWYYEDLWHTPLILAGPGLPRGVRLGGLAANLDIFPTVLEALDIPAGPWLDGESLFGGRVPKRERVFAHGHQTSAVLERDRRKLVLHIPKMFLMPDGSEPPLQLFDLARDPEELEEQSKERTVEAGELRRQIERWQSEHERAVIDSTSPAAEAVLRKMGYLGDGEDTRVEQEKKE